MLTPLGINLVSLLYVSLKYFCTPFERTIISSAYFEANFSPNLIYFVANPPHLDLCQSKPCIVTTILFFYIFGIHNIAQEPSAW